MRHFGVSRPSTVAPTRPHLLPASSVCLVLRNLGSALRGAWAFKASCAAAERGTASYAPLRRPQHRSSPRVRPAGVLRHCLSTPCHLWGQFLAWQHVFGQCCAVAWELPLFGGHRGRESAAVLTLPLACGVSGEEVLFVVRARPWGVCTSAALRRCLFRPTFRPPPREGYFFKMYRARSSQPARSVMGGAGGACRLFVRGDGCALCGCSW